MCPSERASCGGVTRATGFCSRCAAVGGFSRLVCAFLRMYRDGSVRYSGVCRPREGRDGALGVAAQPLTTAGPAPSSWVAALGLRQKTRFVEEAVGCQG